MKLLTKSQEGILQGNAGGLDLPAGARIYLGQGIPTMFRLAGIEADTAHHEGWLHIPGDLLATMRQNLIVQGSNLQFSHVANIGVEADDLTLYPVLVSGRVRAIVTVAAERTLDLSPEVRDSILVALLGRYADSPGDDDRNQLGDFLACLFHRDRSLEQFQQTVLELMTRQWPGTLGAVYYASSGAYKLRLAVGDINLSDRLDGTLDATTVEHWTDAVRRRQYFIPADMLPSYPIILGHPPSFLFVHPGVISDQTEYLTVIAMPGDIGVSEVAAVQQIAELTRHINESQFSTTSQLMDLYAQLNHIQTSQARFRAVLADTYRTVRRQLSLSRLVIACPGQDTSVVTGNGDSEPTVKLVSVPPAPAVLTDNLPDSGPVIVTDVSREPRLRDRVKSYRDAGVLSEILFPLRTSEDALGYVAFGSPLTGDHLRTHRPLLEKVVQFLSLCYSLYGKSKGHDAVVGAIKDENVNVAAQRLNTIAKLAGGYFHDLMEHLSVVVGQNEIIDSAITEHEAAVAAQVILNGSSRVQRAADRIAAYLDNLRNLCLLTSDKLNRLLSSRKLLEELPTIVSGHARQIKDSKNVALTFNTDASKGRNFDLTYRQLYDYVLPFVLGLMDEAIGSDSLTVALGDDEAEPSLRFEFPATVIGHATLEGMLSRTFSHSRLESQSDHEGSMTFDDAVLSFGMITESMCRVVISFGPMGSDGLESGSQSQTLTKGEKEQS